MRLWAVRALAEILRGPILEVVQWIGDNQLWLTVVSVAVVMIWVGWSNRHGLAGATDSVDEIVEGVEGVGGIEGAAAEHVEPLEPPRIDEPPGGSDAPETPARPR